MKEVLVRLFTWLCTSRYTAHLEAEVTRLRAENRELMNVVLQAHGLPVLPSHQPEKPLVKMRSRVLPSQWRTRMENLTAARHVEEKTQ